MFYLPIKFQRLVENCPNIHKSGSVRGMKKLGYWNKSAVAVRCGNYIYNIDVLPVDNQHKILDSCRSY